MMRRESDVETDWAAAPWPVIGCQSVFHFQAERKLTSFDLEELLGTGTRKVTFDPECPRAHRMCPESSGNSI